MFKKIFAIILRIVLSCATLAALYLTLTTQTTIQVPVPGLVNSIVDKSVSNSGNSDLESGMKFFKSIGAENVILKQLPKKIKIKTSYQGLYNTTVNYQKNDKLEASDLGLKDGNNTQKSLNDLILTYVNSYMSENQASLNNASNKYKIFYYVMLGVFILAVILILFGKKFAVVPLLIGGIGSYTIISMFAGQLQSDLQNNIYSGITVVTGSGYLISLIATIIISIIWLFCAKIGKNKKQGKHAA